MGLQGSSHHDYTHKSSKKSRKISKISPWQRAILAKLNSAGTQLCTKSNQTKIYFWVENLTETLLNIIPLFTKFGLDEGQWQTTVVNPFNSGHSE